MSYNGWANRDTWLVALWLDNDRSNYQKVKANKSKIVKLKKELLFRWLRANLKFGDKIDWSKVRVTEVKEAIKDVY